MTTSMLKERLLGNINRMEVIDAHEHLGPEQARLDAPVDVFSLFHQYTLMDLTLAGMTWEGVGRLLDPRVPLDVRWREFSPYWARIRNTSFSRTALMAARTFYGCEDINGANYMDLSAAIREANIPGIYDRALRRACNIRLCITQSAWTDGDYESPDHEPGLMTPVRQLVAYNESFDNWESIAHPPFDKHADVRTLDDYLDAVERYVLKAKSEGAVGLKMHSTPFGKPGREEALSFFDGVKSGRIAAGEPDSIGAARPNPLRDYIVDRTIKLAGKSDLVVAVHAGVLPDFRQLSPANLIPLVATNPEVRFDVYHLGFPFVKETLMLAKMFPNVWLNFAWAYVMCPSDAKVALNDTIDLLPGNKVLGFGGDYRHQALENVYGHLAMARETMAEVLEERISRREMTEDDALGLASKWLYDNPKALYNLDRVLNKESNDEYK